MKLKLTYKPNTDSLNAPPDGKLESVAEALCKVGGNYIFASELLFQWIRVMVKRGVINHEDVSIFWNNPAQNNQLEQIFINKEGKLDHWPQGFCDNYDKTLSELLDLI